MVKAKKIGVAVRIISGKIISALLELSAFQEPNHLDLGATKV